MPDRSEKERRRQIMNELTKKAEEEFEKSLPLDRELFKKLFDFLDVELGGKDCDNTLILTKQFLKENYVGNMETVISWIEEHGGGCDCEVLANVEFD